MTHPIFRLIIVTALVSTTSCATGSTSTTPDVTPINIAAVAKLQLAVGTATIGYSGGTIVGTNLVATFRAADGHSAVLANTPTLTGPANFVIGFKGSPNSLTGVLPNALSAAITAAGPTGSGGYPAAFGAGFGPLVGVFGYGMAADNLLSAQVATRLNTLNSLTGIVCQDLGHVAGANVESSPAIFGSSNVLLPATSEAQSNELGLPVGSGADYTPYQLNSRCPVSLLATLSAGNPATSDFPINYYGGPPAWPSPQGYGSPGFFVGYPLGFTDFSATPVAGKYSLDVAYATNANSTTYGHIDAAATLHTTNALPPLAIASATIHSDGTGTVGLTVPPGVFETIVLVRTFDCDHAERPNAQNDNYAIVSHSTGTQELLFASNLGPPNNAGERTLTFCQGVDGGYGATAYAVGFDYPAYESSYPFDLSQTPKITNGDGHTGQADVTTSAPFIFTTGL